jgi:hypothetical protein
VFIFRLFVPSRYIEFSINVFYCVATGACIRVAVGAVVPRFIAFPVASTLLVVLAALTLYRVGIYDYSSDAGLYRFVESTPKTSLMAGPPDLMDSVLTFGRRKAFVTYELSHTWYPLLGGHQKDLRFLPAYWKIPLRSVNSAARMELIT